MTDLKTTLKMQGIVLDTTDLENKQTDKKTNTKLTEIEQQIKEAEQIICESEKEYNDTCIACISKSPKYKRLQKKLNNLRQERDNIKKDKSLTTIQKNKKINKIIVKIDETKEKIENEKQLYSTEIKNKKKELKEKIKEAKVRLAGLNKDKKKLTVEDNRAKNIGEWTKLLDIDPDTGKIRKSPQNYIIFLNNHEKYKGRLGYNIIRQRPTIDKKSLHDHQVDIIFNDTYQLFDGYDKTVFSSAFSQVIHENSFNPIQEYLQSLEWDGEKRLETIFIDWLYAEDTKLIRAMTRIWFIAAIKRALVPGCQFDNILVLQCSEGGGGKTTIAKRLGLDFGNGEENYYQEISCNDMEDAKKAAEKLNEGWIVSIDELSGLSKKDSSKIKSFLSGTSEKVRMSYGRFAQDNPRHCVFIGSTNEDAFLKDYTGNLERRWWIIPVQANYKTSRVYHEFTKTIVDQIWAEAYAYYMENPKQDLSLSKELSNELEEIQDNYKSYNNDPDIDEYRIILEREYWTDENGELASESDFISQLNGQFLKSNNMIKSYLSCIPDLWIKNYFISKHINAYKSGKYVVKSLKNGYSFLKKRYKNGPKINCFVMENWIRPENSKNENPDENLQNLILNVTENQLFT